jgi:redox-sensing transcriptional repressor
MKKQIKISDSTVRRLSKYYRTLGIFLDEKHETVSSDELAKRDGITPAQVRKDLSFFGNFGKRGLGYNIKELREEIAKILGINQKWNVALIGAGNIGTALLDYGEFKKQGFIIKLVLDNDVNKIGKVIKGHEIKDINNLEEEIKRGEIQIAIIAVPAYSAQTVADKLVASGVKAILNFAPMSLKVPENVAIRNENMSIEIESLSYALVNKAKENGK